MLTVVLGNKAAAATFCYEDSNFTAAERRISMQYNVKDFIFS